MEHNRLTMKNRPVSERPYEKCLKSGPESLSDGELLAVILRTGTREYTSLELAWQILDLHPVYKGLASLYHLDLETLRTVPGIGKVKAVEILCVLELSRRFARTSVNQTLQFSSPEEVAAYYMEQMRHLEHEKVYLLLLNGKHRLIREIEIANGTANSACVSVRKVMMEALRHRAVFMILIHNHPSGDPEPSREDLLLTDRLKKAGELIEIPLSDHIIIGDRRFVSLREYNDLL